MASLKAKLVLSVHYRVGSSFPALYSDVTRMSLALWIDQEAASFAYRSRSKMSVRIEISFVTDCFYLCGVNLLLRSREGKKRKSTRKGVAF